MSVGGLQEALRVERDKLAKDYAKLGVKHANLLTRFENVRKDLIKEAASLFPDNGPLCFCAMGCQCRVAREAILALAKEKNDASKTED